jgi:hypothetical protein
MRRARARLPFLSSSGIRAQLWQGDRRLLAALLAGPVSVSSREAIGPPLTIRLPKDHRDAIAPTRYPGAQGARCPVPRFRVTIFKEPAAPPHLLDNRADLRWEGMVSHGLRTGVSIRWAQGLPTRPAWEAHARRRTGSPAIVHVSDGGSRVALLVRFARRLRAHGRHADFDDDRESLVHTHFNRVTDSNRATYPHANLHSFGHSDPWRDPDA